MPHALGLTLDVRISQIKKILEKESTGDDTVQRIGFDIKTQWKMLAKAMNICIEEDIHDCKVCIFDTKYIYSTQKNKWNS